MGRPRKPTALLVLSGAFRNHPERAASRVNEPVPHREIGLAPGRLSPAEVAIWDSVCAEAPPGVLKCSDRKMLENYCRFQARVNREGGNAADYAQLKSYLVQFGMSPASRSHVIFAPEDNGNEFTAI